MTVELGDALEAFVRDLIASGRYPSRDEVLRYGVRLIQEREARLAAVQAALDEGLADLDAGHLTPADEVLDGLKARCQAMAEQR